MTAKVGWSTPMLHVSSVEQSIRFYEQLGFTIIATDRGDPLGWARIECEGGAIMFLRAEKPIDASAQAVLLYMYTQHLTELRDTLVSKGVKVGPITRPDYMRSGELRLDDPDGYIVLVGHWGKAEHEEWLKWISRPEA